MCFAFLPDQSEAAYQWALIEIKTLYSRLEPTTIGLAPGAVSTDCDQAFRNAILAVFPYTPLLLYLWHTNKNIQ